MSESISKREKGIPEVGWEMKESTWAGEPTQLPIWVLRAHQNPQTAVTKIGMEFEWSKIKEVSGEFAVCLLPPSKWPALTSLLSPGKRDRKRIMLKVEKFFHPHLCMY